MRGPKSGWMSTTPIPYQTENFEDLNNNGIWNIDEPFTDIGNGIWDIGEEYTDTLNGKWDEGEKFTDALNGSYDEGEEFTDSNNNGNWDQSEPLFIDSRGNGVMDDIMDYYYDPENQSILQNSLGGLTPIQESNLQEQFEDLNADNFWTEGEPYEDQDENGKYTSYPYFWDLNGDSEFTPAEKFIDAINGKYDEGEEFVDDLNNIYDQDEQFKDKGNERHDNGVNVVLVDLDDESWRLIPDAWPYSREKIWARTVRNLTKAGAKVIVFDIEFDRPDHKSESALGILRNYKDVTGFDVDAVISEDASVLKHGDDVLADAVNFAKSKGTEVIFASKWVSEATRFPPEYINHPSDRILEAEPREGLINSIDSEIDAVSREYLLFMTLNNMETDSTYYLSIAVSAVRSYYNIPDDVLPFFDTENKFFEYGPLKVKTIGHSQTFYIDYYGPASAASPFGKAYSTFFRYPLSNILDDEDFDMGDEDSDWISNFDSTSSLNQMMLMMDPTWEVMESPFRDKIVMVGVSAEIFHDVKTTPFFSYKGKQYLTPGFEMHANAIQQLLDKSYIEVKTGSLILDDISRWNHISIIIGLSFLTFFVIFKLDPKWGALIIVLEILAWLSYSMGGFSGDYFWLFRYLPGVYNSPIPIKNPVLIPVVFPMATIFLTYGINVAYKLISEGKDKAFLKSAFGNYISPELIDDMFDNKQAPALGGDNGMRTAYFTDIASFSTFSEKLSASELVTLLNEYLTVMTDILLNGGGTLDKYEGDAIIAFFGAPADQPDNAFRGLKVGVEMQNGCDMLRKKWQSEGDKWPEVVKQMRTRIGINHGDLVCGNMGALNRMNYTMMGDTVNTAARLEEGAKQYGIYLATTIETLQVAGEDEFEWRIVDKTRYMGKNEATTTVEILDFKGKLSTELLQMIEIFNEGFELYQNMKWDEAIEIFEKSEKHEEEYPGRPTNPSKKLISRCEEYKETPPVSGDEEWDGVYTMTKK